ncbi:g5291 [Coccomyxa viridis]|uniref:G5291 protein n=1 Tax=Coccomyxa viridis TaxID=1274662 RepID=A0ABP1FSG7_9CHLO
MSFSAQVGFLKGLMELRLLNYGELEDQMELSTLTRLQSICMEQSEMNRLPAWMGALANLLYLQLEGVMLVAWSLAGFKSLQSLDISSCNVVQVIDSMGQLTSLTSLRIVDCRLAELSSSISRLQNLRDLDLDCSFFPEFPRALQALRAPELRRVCLEGNSRLSRQNDAAREDKGYRALPVKAADLAWLLHHPRLQTVSITATKAEAAELQAFKQELCKVSGCDVLNIKCFG